MCIRDSICLSGRLSQLFALSLTSAAGPGPACRPTHADVITTAAVLTMNFVFPPVAVAGWPKRERAIYCDFFAATSQSHSHAPILCRQFSERVKKRRSVERVDRLLARPVLMLAAASRAEPHSVHAWVARCKAVNVLRLKHRAAY